MKKETNSGFLDRMNKLKIVSLYVIFSVVSCEIASLSYIPVYKKILEVDIWKTGTNTLTNKQLFTVLHITVDK